MQIEHLQNEFPLTTKAISDITVAWGRPIPAAESVVNAVRASGAKIRVEAESWMWWDYLQLNLETNEWEEWQQPITCPRIVITASQSWYQTNYLIRYWVREREQDIIALMLGMGRW